MTWLYLIIAYIAFTGLICRAGVHWHNANGDDE